MNRATEDIIVDVAVVGLAIITLPITIPLFVVAVVAYHMCDKVGDDEETNQAPPTEASLISQDTISTCARCGHTRKFEGWGRVCPNCRK